MMTENDFETWRKIFDEFKDELYKQVVRLNTCYEEKTAPELKSLSKKIDIINAKCVDIQQAHTQCSTRTEQTLRRVSRIQDSCYYCNHCEDAKEFFDQIGELKTATAILTEKSKWYWMGLGLLGGFIPVVITIAVALFTNIFRGMP